MQSATDDLAKALKETMASRESVYMVLELVPGGELYDKLLLEGHMEQAPARRIFQQLLDGLEYCHSRGIYHRQASEVVLLAAK